MQQMIEHQLQKTDINASAIGWLIPKPYEAIKHD